MSGLKFGLLIDELNMLGWQSGYAGDCKSSHGDSISSPSSKLKSEIRFMATLSRKIPKSCNTVPLGLVKIYWVAGGCSLASISNCANGDRQIHCCNWVNTECFPLKEILEDIIKIEIIKEC